MKNKETRSIFQWDLIIGGNDLERIISIKDNEHITCQREDACGQFTIKITDDTILSYFDTDDENLIHAYLVINEKDEYEALALLDTEMHSLMSNIPLDKCIDVLNDYFTLNIQDHISITRQSRSPNAELYPCSNRRYSTELFYKTKFNICKHCYTPTQINRINELLSVMENRNDTLYSLADKKLSYIMRINNYTQRSVLTFKNTLSKRFTQCFESVQGNDMVKNRIMKLLEAQEYCHKPLFILLTGPGPKSTIARAMAKAIKAPISFIPIDNYNNEAELLGCEKDASIIVKHWQKTGSTDSIIVLKDFDKFVNNSPVNAYRLMANFEDNQFSDKFTTAYNTSRSIIIATAYDTDLPSQITEKFHIVPTNDTYTCEQRRRIVKGILDSILGRYKIDLYNLDISNEALNELGEEALLKGFKSLETNLELFITVNCAQLKKEVTEFAMKDYRRVIDAFKTDKSEINTLGGKLFCRLFDGMIEEI